MKEEEVEMDGERQIRKDSTRFFGKHYLGLLEMP
jgi:hypothetical protein